MRPVSPAEERKRTRRELPWITAAATCISLAGLGYGIAVRRPEVMLMSVAFFAMVAVYFYAIQGLIRDCWTVEEAARATGRSLESMQALVAERKIEPMFVVDGVPVFDPVQLWESAALLRPADERTDSLLIPATLRASDANSLVRPADAVTQVAAQ